MSEDNFRKGLRSAVRGLWSGALSNSDFESAMKSTISRNLQKAWIEGSTECGISADELSEAEIEARDAFIDNQYSFIGGFGEAIGEDGDNRLRDLYSRVEYWVDRYSEAKANGRAMACADEKAEFELGPTKEHCRTCTGLNGRVYRNSVWVIHNAVPPHNWNFECRGGCRCRLKSTSKPITRGKFPVGLLG